MAREWTSEQDNAIHSFGGNILVSAAAGSGKTAVLVERVISKITDKENPVDIDKLLIVTFTNAASAEMKSRISVALSDILGQDSANYNIQKQLSLLPSAQIFTIDKFCIQLLRDNFFNAGVEQDFSILDESELNDIENEALANVLERKYSEKSSGFISLVELLSSPKSDVKLVDAIRKLYRYINSQPFPFYWLKTVTDYYNPDVPMEETVWYKIVSNEISGYIDYCKLILTELKSSLNEDIDLYDKNLAMLGQDEKIINYVDSIKNDFDKLSSYLTNDLKFDRCVAKSHLKDKREVYKKIIGDKIAPLICVTSEEHRSDMTLIYPQMKSLFEIEKEFHEESMKMKREKNAYSFNDIEHFALDLVAKNEDGVIKKTELAESLSNEYSEILIDEYQDTNRAQDLLFETLSNGNNLFMVGDVKQSIYRFRLAMPKLFIEKKNKYHYFDEGVFPQKIMLHKNFRSHEDICKYVNFIFSSVMSNDVGGVDYNEEEYLNHGIDYIETGVPSAQIQICDGAASGDDYYIQESKLIAKFIKNKVDSKEQINDNGKVRDIKYSDFAVLFRKANGIIPIYTDEFDKIGIPVLSENSNGLFSSKEIILLVELLRIIDNPMQDIPLLSVMMSPLFGFSADEIASIRVNNKYSSFYTAVSNSKDEKTLEFLNTLQHFRDIGATTSVAFLVRKIIEETFYISVLSSGENAQQKKANINSFIDIAEKYDSSDSMGLTAFMRYIDTTCDSGNTKSASINSSLVDSVRMMSIHHSKGLEFPVVILAASTRKYNQMESSEPLLLSDEYGIGVKLHDEENLYQCKTLPYVALASTIKNDNISESIRVLYVAMTRAKEQFVTFVTGINIESKLKKLQCKIHDGNVYPYDIKDINCDADIILLTALLHLDGVALRNMIEADIDINHSDFNLDIKFLVPCDEEVVEDKETTVLASKDIINQIKEKISYSYKYSNLSSVAAKRNASELDKIESNMEFFAKSRPAFMNKKGLSPSERGTAMHSFMQYCSYENAKQNLEEEIKRLADNNFITNEQANSLERNKLNDFFNGEFASRIFSSIKVYREIKFSSFLTAKEIENVDSEEKILVQGIADCAFEESDGIVIVDYKTDNVKTDDELIKRYEKQLAFYKSSIEKSLNNRVKEVYIYSFALNKAICLNIL